MGYSASLLPILFNANSLSKQVAWVASLTQHRLIYQGKSPNQNRNLDTYQEVNTGHYICADFEPSIFSHHLFLRFQNLTFHQKQK